MLKQLRKKKTAKRILWALAIIIIPPFIFWGSGSLVQGKKGNRYAGEVFGKKISFARYKDALSAVTNRAKLQYGDSFVRIKQYLDLNRQAWERIILLSEAQKRKTKISDDEVIEAVQKMPLFREQGVFDKGSYDYVLKYILGVRPRRFEEDIRGSLAIARIYAAVTADAQIEKEELEKEYQRYQKQWREDKEKREEEKRKEKKKAEKEKKGKAANEAKDKASSAAASGEKDAAATEKAKPLTKEQFRAGLLAQKRQLIFGQFLAQLKEKARLKDNISPRPAPALTPQSLSPRPGTAPPPPKDYLPKEK